MVILGKKQLAIRLGQMVLVLIGISFITFCLVMLAPGDPVRQMIAGNEDIVVSQVEIDALRHELGLDKPFIFQYLDWLGRVLHGNFGFSFMMKNRLSRLLRNPCRPQSFWLWLLRFSCLSSRSLSVFIQP